MRFNLVLGLLAFISTASSARVVDYVCETSRFAVPKNRVLGTQEVKLDSEDRQLKVYLNVAKSIIGDELPITVVAMPVIPRNSEQKKMGYKINLYKGNTDFANWLVGWVEAAEGEPIRLSIVNGLHYFVSCEPK